VRRMRVRARPVCCAAADDWREGGTREGAATDCPSVRTCTHSLADYCISLSGIRFIPVVSRYGEGVAGDGGGQGWGYRKRDVRWGRSLCGGNAVSARGSYSYGGKDLQKGEVLSLQ